LAVQSTKYKYEVYKDTKVDYTVYRYSTQYTVYSTQYTIRIQYRIRIEAPTPLT